MSVTASIDQRIIRQAGLQHGVIGVHQLRDLGVDRSAVRRRISSGWLRRVAPGIYAVGPTAIAMGECVSRDDPWLMAAVLHGGPGAVLSHAAAAARLGAWDRWDGAITVTTAHKVRACPQLPACYRRSSSLHPMQVELIGNIPTTSPERTMLDLGTELSAWQACSVLRELRYLDLVEVRRVEDLLEQHWGERGTAVVRHAIHLHRSGSAGTRSFTEDYLLAGLLLTDLPAPRVNDRSAANVQGIEPDFAWPRVKLIVEVDGHTSHDQPRKREQDRLRDEALEAAGWLVLRFDARRVRRNRTAVVREIVRQYQVRAAALR